MQELPLGQIAGRNQLCFCILPHPRPNPLPLDIKSPIRIRKCAVAEIIRNLGEGIQVIGGQHSKSANPISGPVHDSIAGRFCAAVVAVPEQIERAAEPDYPDAEYDPHEDAAEGEEGYQGFLQLDHQGGQQEQNRIVISIRLFYLWLG